MRQNFFQENKPLILTNSSFKLSYSNKNLNLKPIVNVMKPLEVGSIEGKVQSVLSKNISLPVNMLNVNEKNLSNTNSLVQFTNRNSGKKYF